MGCAVSVSGVVGIQRLVYTATHGFLGGIAVVTCIPQVIASARVSVGWTDGINTVLLTNCLIKHMATKKGPQGETLMVLQIHDRRWRWDFETALGQWNIANDDGSLDTATQISARELVSRLFSEGMGETVDCTAIPSDDYPFVDFQGEKARVACERLLSRYGCDIAFDVGTDSFVVVKLGTGATLPTSAVMTYGLSAGFNPWPDNIRIYCGRTIFETMFELEAVGEDLDGTIKPIAELSYMPTGGWPGGNPKELIPQTSDKRAYGLANKTVGKWFRIKNVVGGGLTIPGGITLPAIEHALPLRGTRLLTFGTGSEQYGSPPLLEGVFVTVSEGGPSQQFVNSANWTQYDGGFTVDRERGIVQTSTPVWKLNGAGDAFVEASLFLTISHYVQDEQKQFLRYYKSANIASNGVPTETRVRENYWGMVRGVYEDGSLTDTIDNQSALDSLIDLELTAWAAGYVALEATTAVYGGVQYITLGGQIRVVQWTVDHNAGARTVASQNTEYLLGVKPRLMRRREAEAEPREFVSARRRREMRGRK